jgi:hypothetical protein
MTASLARFLKIQECITLSRSAQISEEPNTKSQKYVLLARILFSHFVGLRT